MPSLDTNSVRSTIATFGLRRCPSSRSQPIRPPQYRVVPIEEHLYAVRRLPLLVSSVFFFTTTRVSGEPLGHGAARAASKRERRQTELARPETR